MEKQAKINELWASLQGGKIVLKYTFNGKRNQRTMWLVRPPSSAWRNLSHPTSGKSNAFLNTQPLRSAARDAALHGIARRT